MDEGTVKRCSICGGMDVTAGTKLIQKRKSTGELILNEDPQVEFAQGEELTASLGSGSVLNKK